MLSSLSETDHGEGQSWPTTGFNPEPVFGTYWKGIQMRVFTHIHIDLDAAASVWFVRQFLPDARDAEVVFVPANWDGAGMEGGDLALDIRAGSRGIKGSEQADGTIGSCFALLVSRFAPATDQEALRPLSVFVDLQDSKARPVELLARGADESGKKVLDALSPSRVLRALQAVHPRNDALVLERMSEIFSGLLENGRARQRAVVEADHAELIGTGRVAIVRDAREFATNEILFEERGVHVIVYVDGHNLGVIRKDTVAWRMDHPVLREVVAAAGEEIGDGEGKWFAHKDGFIFARGTRKAPATSRSRVRPEDLAAAAARVVAYDVVDGMLWCAHGPFPEGTYCVVCGPPVTQDTGTGEHRQVR
jgi:hypothetical protein